MGKYIKAQMCMPYSQNTSSPDSVGSARASRTWTEAGSLRPSALNSQEAVKQPDRIKDLKAILTEK